MMHSLLLKKEQESVKKNYSVLPYLPFLQHLSHVILMVQQNVESKFNQRFLTNLQTVSLAPPPITLPTSYTK